MQYGAPGSGKTSIIHSIAGELGLDVYIISVSRGGLDDDTLQELIADLPERCIALMEDIDAAFHHSITRTPDNPAMKLITGDREKAPSPDGSPRVSLSGLLNALDGVAAQEGRLLFATTNRYETIDPALRRPGRMDVHVEFKLASQSQAAGLFKRFYMSDDVAATGEKEVPGSGKNLVPSHRKGLDLAELVLLSEKFKEHIPDGQFSMASLQGYLMMHKDQPHNAIERVEAWVEGERVKKRRVVKNPAKRLLMALKSGKSRKSQSPKP